MAKIVDNVIAARILYLLVLPFYKWQAFKEGIIDENGAVIQQGAKSDNWTMLHRLVSRLKILLGKLPGGKSPIASAAAAYLLVKECVESNNEPYRIELVYDQVSKLEVPDELISEVTEFYSDLLEDGEAVPTNNISNIAGIKPGDEPPGPKGPGKKKKMMKRKMEVM